MSDGARGGTSCRSGSPRDNDRAFDSVLSREETGMSSKDKGKFAGKHPRGTVPDEKIAIHLRGQIMEGGIPCAAAFAIAGRLGITPQEVGVTIDLLEAPIDECQLGLFGYGKGKKKVKAAENVPPALHDAIMKSLVEGRLPCRSAWDLAEKSAVSRMDIAAACETLGIRISRCQLGSF